MAEDPTIAGIQILVLCTANVCRSPMAEVLLRARLDAARIGEEVAVGSAGFLTEGMPAAAEAIEVMADRGLGLEDHRSRRTTPEMVASADLVLCMARRHLRESVTMRPEAFGRTFTLKEIVRRSSEVGGRAPDETLSGWLERLGEARAIQHHLGDSPEDDVADPVGQPLRVFRRTADEIEELLGRFTAAAW